MGANDHEIDVRPHFVSSERQPAIFRVQLLEDLLGIYADIASMPFPVATSVSAPLSVGDGTVSMQPAAHVDAPAVSREDGRPIRAFDLDSRRLRGSGSFRLLVRPLDADVDVVAIAVAGNAPAALPRLLDAVGAEGEPAHLLVADGVGYCRPVDGRPFPVVFASAFHRVPFCVRPTTWIRACFRELVVSREVASCHE